LLSRVDLSAIPYADSVFADEMPGALLLGAMEASRNITITGASAVALDALASVDLLTVHIAGALDTPSLRAAGRVDVTAGSWSADHLERASRLRLQLGAGGGAFGALTSAEIEEIGTAGLVTMPSMSSVRILRVRTSGGGCLRMDGLEQAFLYPGRPLLDGSYMAGNVSVVSDGSGRVAFEAPRLVEVDGLVLADATVALDALERASVVSVLRSPSAQTEVRLPALVEVGALDVESWTWNWRTSYLGFPSRDTGGREPLQVRVPNLERATRVSIHGIEEVVLLDLSGLTDVGELDLEDVGGAMTLRLDSLLRAGRSRAAGPFGAPHLIVSENDGRRHDGVDLNRVGGLSALDLPALETISSVRVTASPALQAVRAPRLADAGDLLFTELTDTQWGVLLAPAIPTPPSTTHFDLHLPRLASVNDLFIVHDRRFNLLDLPSLTDVSFRLRARDAPNLGAVNAPVLASSDAWIELTGASALTSVSLPALHRLGRLALNGTALTALDLPALTWLGDALSAWANPSLGALRLTGLTHAGELYLDDNDGLTVIGMPALAEVGPAWVGGHGVLGEVSLPSLELISGRLDVVDNAALTTLALPALRSVAEVHVVGNPALDACAVEADVSGASLGGVEVEPSCALAP
jgi:hypothetical protein